MCCLPGMAMGILMLKLVQNGLEMGLNTCVYFVLMGLICWKHHNR